MVIWKYFNGATENENWYIVNWIMMYKKLKLSIHSNLNIWKVLISITTKDIKWFYQWNDSIILGVYFKISVDIHI